MIRRPPTSPLFPYTTLFRPRAAPRHEPHGPVVGQLVRVRAHDEQVARGLHGREPPARHVHRGRSLEDRSEEHTSELQSRQYLVCRLLLEKKKMCYVTLPLSV